MILAGTHIHCHDFTDLCHHPIDTKNGEWRKILQISAIFPARRAFVAVPMHMG
jgi:hypothetical protein